MLVFLPIVAITGWVSYRNAAQATEQFTYAMANEVGERLQERVLSFFEIPRRVLAYNQDLADNGCWAKKIAMKWCRSSCCNCANNPC
jgi:hypothetical protein